MIIDKPYTVVHGQVQLG